MKRFISVFAIVGLITFGTTSYASSPIKVMVKNEQIKTDTPPIIEKGRVLVPIRVVAESLGATVAWDQKAKTATVNKWSESIKLTVGQKMASVEGRLNSSGEISLDVSVKIINSRVYVPLRFLSQEYGYRVAWNDNMVTIQSPLTPDQQTKLYEGDLAEAREMAMSNVWSAHYEHTPLTTSHATERYGTTFLFPEGEALRFYVIDGDETVFLMEYKEDFLVATWQAHLDNLEEDPIQQLLEDKLTDRTGSKPEIKKVLFYHSSGIFGPSGWTRNGRVDLDGKVTETGYERYLDSEVTDSTGTISLTMPDEKRNEVVKAPDLK